MPNELLPSNIGFGTVVGRFGSAPLIAGDADGFPDFSPATGLTVTFTPSTAAVIDATASPAPVTIEMVPIVCGLDSQGYLVGGDGQRGVKLIATDDTDINPSGWTYSVTFLRAGAKVAAFRDFSMSLPQGVTKDIALTIPVPSSSGVSLSQAQAAEAAAVSAASAATAAAAAAAASAATFVPATVDTLGQATTFSKTLVKTSDATAARDVIGAAVKDGRVVHAGVFTKAAVIATLDAAEAAGKGTIAYFPPGVYDVGNGLSLSGYSCQIRGAGAAMPSSGVAAGTVFYASTQTGPVMDFTGWAPPNDFRGKVTHKDFFLRGSGAADPTKANTGLQIDFINSATFTDIAVIGTGGACVRITESVYGYGAYLCDFERFTLNAPIGAKTNDVPYFHATGTNGNRYSRIGLISRLLSADTGASGAVVVDGRTNSHSATNKFDAWWFENLHIPNNGCVFSHSGVQNILSDFQFFDIKKESGATNTCYFRFLPCNAGNYGGNTLRGVIPGQNSVGGLDPDFGVDLSQPFNVIDGIKGFRGNNVVIASGVGSSTVRLRGSVSGANTLGWVDNSGLTTNHLIDTYLGTEVRPATWTVNGSIPAAGPNIQVFTSGGTWTKPAGATTVRVTAIGGGGGGGSGRRGAAASVRCGGGGGGGGSMCKSEFAASLLPATVTILSGVGGTGGAAVTADGTNGNAGTSGGISTFGAYVRAGGGGGGSGGTASSGSAGNAGLSMFSGGAGGAAATNGGVGASTNNIAQPVSAGAPAGGGITSTDVPNAGGAGVGSYSVSAPASLGGVVDTTPPGAAVVGVANLGLPGGSGGGGAASITTAAQAGASGGIYGGGGAGGGASLNGNNSGAGGDGAPGIVIVTAW